MKLIHDSDGKDLVRPWKQRQAKRRRKLAISSCDIDIRDFRGVNAVHTNTILTSQAFEEKTQQRKNMGTADWAKWDDEVEDIVREARIECGADGNARNLRGSTVRQQSASASAPSRASSSGKMSSSPGVFRNPDPPKAGSSSNQSTVVTPSPSVASLPLVLVRRAPRALPKRAQSTSMDLDYKQHVHSLP
jgi:hypothetical protein